jgi:hypothetical protein
MKNIFIRCFTFCLALLLAGCATGYTGSTVAHGFEFHAGLDSPDIEVIAYRYGSPVDTIGGRIVRTAQDTKDGKDQQGVTIVSAEMPVGKELYVKWRIKATGQVLEDTANLETTWKRSMEGWVLYFWVNKDKLQVYVMSQDLRGYFTFEEGQQIDDYEYRMHLPRSLRGRSRRMVYLLYPSYQVDPHLPPHLRRSK